MPRRMVRSIVGGRKFTSSQAAKHNQKKKKR